MTSLSRLWLSVMVAGIAGCSSSSPSTVAKDVPSETSAPTKDRPDDSGDAMTTSSTLSAMLIPHKIEILLGEPIHLTYRLSNQGESALQFREGGNQRNRLGRFDDYQIQVRDSAGRALPELDSNPNFGGMTWAPTVASRKSFEHEIFLPHWVVLDSPGTFTISSERRFTTRVFAKDSWYGESGDEITLRAETQITVLPADPGAMGAVIESLGKAMFGKGESDARTQAWQKMGAINDERVIPWFQKAMATRKYDFVSSALTALGRFQSDDALASIESAMQLRGADLVGEFAGPELAEGSADNLRQHVAHTLSESPHPDAYALLLKMSTDRYDSIRLTVLHAIAKKRPKDARQRITAFSNDASAMVRDEAQRYLSER